MGMPGPRRVPFAAHLPGQPSQALGVWGACPAAKMRARVSLMCGTRSGWGCTYMYNAMHVCAPTGARLSHVGCRTLTLPCFGLPEAGQVVCFYQVQC